MYAEAVDHKIDVSNEISCDSGKDMDCTEGKPLELMAMEVGETGDLEDTTERLATDSGSGILAILVIDRDSVVSSTLDSELIVGDGG